LHLRSVNQRHVAHSDKVVHIVKPAMRIITSPTVQLGLDLQYPSLGLREPKLRFVGVHRR
jgi:hypothetical protein